MSQNTVKTLKKIAKNKNRQINWEPETIKIRENVTEKLSIKTPKNIEGDDDNKKKKVWLDKNGKIYKNHTNEGHMPEDFLKNKFGVSKELVELSGSILQNTNKLQQIKDKGNQDIEKAKETVLKKKIQDKIKNIQNKAKTI